MLTLPTNAMTVPRRLRGRRLATTVSSLALISYRLTILGAIYLSSRLPLFGFLHEVVV